MTPTAHTASTIKRPADRRAALHVNDGKASSPVSVSSVVVATLYLFAPVPNNAQRNRLVPLRARNVGFLSVGPMICRARMPA